ncbi:DUF2490 domain-containing protein [Reyranella sp.]|uniref:DUF2490 domain-containing protein n=1 Tax=Reyranella sp. TaxID=1929291 RepID=UPI002F95FD28
MLFALVDSEAGAQTTYSDDFWPEIDLHVRLDEATQVIGMVTYNRDQDSGQVYQAEGGAVVEHRFADWFYGRIGYRHANATDGGPFVENRLLTEQTFRIRLPGKVSIDARTREDFRWLNTGYSMRFRERLQVQRDTSIGDYVFQPYASAEVYFDTRYGQFARYRLIVGSTFPIDRHLSVEPYLARQVDFASSSAVVHALGLILHLSF